MPPSDSTSSTGDAAAAAFVDLAATLAEIEEKYIGEDRGMNKKP